MQVQMQAFSVQASKYEPTPLLEADIPSHVVTDGQLITGQNPHSSGPAAEALMAAVKQAAKAAPTARSGSSGSVR